LATPAHKATAGGQTWTEPICPHCDTGENETFDHMLRCDSPEAIQFRHDIISRLTKYFPTWVPSRFRDTFLAGLEQWLWNSETIRDTNEIPAITHIYSKQGLIGWNGVVRGLLSCAWGPYLLFELKEQQQTTSRVPDSRVQDVPIGTFFSRLIYEIWAAQTDFWKRYQENRHSTHTQPHKDHHSSKRIELQNTVRYLDSLRSKVEPEHTDRYFPSDLPSFLTESSNSQMETYISNYGKVIKASAKRHNHRATASTRKLWTYNGFTRAIQHQFTPIHPTAQQSQIPYQPSRQTRQITTWFKPRNNPQSDPRSHTRPATTGAPLPHKHTRWKNNTPTQRHIHEFFTTR
jgi:hypothetical protein